MESTYIINNDWLTLHQIEEIITGDIKIGLSNQARKQINRCRQYLDRKIEESDEPIYGINTGFGSLHDTIIPKTDLNKLQENLVKSHACGTGGEIPSNIVKAMLFLKVQTLAKGFSGIHLSTVERLIDFYNHQIYPLVYEFGSLGASGDLAPLAHLSLPLLGEGMVRYQGKKLPASEILQMHNWKPIQLKSKEGLALLNGTQMMSAYGLVCLYRAERLIKFANKIGALSLDVFNGRPEPFFNKVHEIRPHVGQQIVAKEILHTLEGSELQRQPKKHVQDPYSFRCIPQVHGASLEAIEYVKGVFLAEINGVTDNPNIFPEEDAIISSGNFHGQPLAIALDFLCIALAELGNISERRTYQLLSGCRGLPDYLINNPGINSGLMIPQYTAASLVSKNKELCTPSSIDSIPSSNGQEDHVSMGANAAIKAYQVISNLNSILAIELLTAAQALSLRRPVKTSTWLEDLVSNFRKQVSFIENDRIFHDDIKKAEEFLEHTDI